jgi:hypothetical protein
MDEFSIHLDSHSIYGFDKLSKGFNLLIKHLLLGHGYAHFAIHCEPVWTAKDESVPAVPTEGFPDTFLMGQRSARNDNRIFNEAEIEILEILLNYERAWAARRRW